MDQEKDYLEMIKDTSDLVAQEKAAQLGDLAVAFRSSERLTNDVEFWRWMGANYPKNLSSGQLVQEVASTKAHWLNTQLQGKGYEWDFMMSQRHDPTKLLSTFNAGDCPTQPPDVKIGTTIFSKKQKNKPHKVSHWVKPIGKPYAAYSYLF